MARTQNQTDQGSGKAADKGDVKAKTKAGSKLKPRGRAGDAKHPRPERSGNPAKRAAAERARMEESRAAANRVSRVPRKVKETGSPRWYAPMMVTFLVVGLLWVVITYLFKGAYPLPYFVENHASDWLVNGNLYLGFAIMLVGFLGLLRWK
ncbi:cell division protein crga [Actinomyces glycerinitolerans]|uniref:Cell division protein CrgA n=1 Tax=Actinomyces glycerinitolerans TaxID=1892869 RepID=A0A1M4S335_9ACTO|nr:MULTISPECIES: cell division protein CrgA [Actinomyces]SHE26642.1 cell division protein crga [Actinomyces glycerinitolerans]